MNTKPFKDMTEQELATHLLVSFANLSRSQQETVLEIVSDLMRFNEKRLDLYADAMGGPNVTPLFPPEGTAA